jgi:hypothetical protein
MLNLVRIWIVLSTVLVGGGWILSALHELNRTGYGLILLPPAAVILFWWQRKGLLSSKNFQRWRHKFLKRFRRRAPQFFLLLAGLSFLGGCLYPALNYDSNSYRLPRVMHWLWAGQWHWIHTFDARMNFAACGMEWLSAPLILFSHTDRLLFLINWISYLMLPGLIFSVFTRLQVRPRVAWWWAWLLPSGWCFALQSASVANDSFAAIYILAAVDLALRARERKSFSDLWLSLLAAALVTGAKQTNLPLVALWLIAAWPALPLFWKAPGRTALVAGCALLVSVVPISLLNYHYCGTWLPLETTGIPSDKHFQLNPFWGMLGNAFCIPVQNLTLPFYNLLPPLYYYWPIIWNQMMHQFLQTSLGAHFASFENFGFLSLVYYHGISEGNAGLGFGICLMVLVTWREGARLRKKGGLVESSFEQVVVLRLLRLVPWGLLLLYMAKVGTYENARQLAPYYLFLFPAWLVRAGHAQVTRQHSWQRLAFAVMTVAALLLATISERPLFPARTIFKVVQSKLPGSDFLMDECFHYLDSNYEIALERRGYFKKALPPDEKVVGYSAMIFFDDETGLWLPYGRRRVECLLPGDPPEGLRALGIHYVVLSGPFVNQTFGNIANWLKQYDASVVDQYAFPKPGRRPADPPDYYIVRLN